MDIFLTGASGFLGRQVLPLLLAEGHTVYSLGRKASQHPSAKLIEVPGDLMEDDWVNSVPWDRIDAVAHLAAAGVKAARRNWRDAFEVNVGGTMKLLAAIKTHASKRPKLLVTRTFYEHVMMETPALREDAYISTKFVSTELIKAWSRDYTGAVCFATLFQVYGPGDDRGSVLTYAAHQLVLGHTAKFGSGLGVRDWLYVDDAATALVSLLNPKIGGQSDWDIGSGQLTSLREMVAILSKIAGQDCGKVDFDPARDRADLDLRLSAKRPVPGWLPRVSLQEGLTRIWAAAKSESLA